LNDSFRLNLAQAKKELPLQQVYQLQNGDLAMLKTTSFGAITLSARGCRGYFWVNKDKQIEHGGKYT
jgi:hypothetical protein